MKKVRRPTSHKTKNILRDERAVSPVIGVILMVAITVILAAVIGAFAFGLADVKTVYIVMATGERVSADTVRIAFQGGQDADHVSSLSASVSFAGNGTSCGANSSMSTAIGNPTLVTCAGAAITEKIHTIVLATFSDGSQQVIFEHDL